MSEKPFDWSAFWRNLILYALATLAGAGGGAAMTPLCQNCPCQTGAEK